ncbi:hypothetical protein N7492_002169 [Penicillium capsulatum]|uniref:Uncharacterized protein n=1 Tax=Penicillium capsulatum TaxID=69766 RepID=A0A9W9LVS9_9EURO|nr:hypothetical protein N7492_002169 [Penicillium capsulatum]KAJ6123222.1 hypothetical protein N7512_005687 [Penicillium capsulatum]
MTYAPNVTSVIFQPSCPSNAHQHTFDDLFKFLMATEPLYSTAPNMRNQLSAAAEVLRQEIKEIVARSEPKSSAAHKKHEAVFTESVHGDKSYEGTLLEDKMFRLLNEMGLAGWGWSLAFLSQARPIINKFSRMHIVTLSEGSTIRPGGDLVEGFSQFVDDTPILSSSSIVIFIVPIEVK